jgi:hypothetical protein
MTKGAFRCPEREREREIKDSLADVISEPLKAAE